MRLLHVITGLGAGGAEQIMMQLVSTLNHDQYEQVVVSLMDEGFFGERVCDLGIRLETIGMHGGSISPLAFYKLRKMIDDVNPDLIQGWMYHANISISMVSAMKYPLVWGIHHSLHDMKQEKYLTQFLIKSGRWLSGTAKKIIYCSERSAEQHAAIGYNRSRAVIIPNGFDTDEFHPSREAGQLLRERLGLPADSVIIGHAARYHPMKNHAGLIRAFSDITTRHPQAFLVMAGTGVDNENKELAKIIERYDLDNKVFLLGECSDMQSIMPALDVYISTSLWGEAFPVVIGEAMSSGVPCIATDIGDSALLINDYGCIVPPGDNNALIHALDDFLGMDKERRYELGEKARQHICDKYSLSSMTEKYASVYRDIVGG